LELRDQNDDFGGQSESFINLHHCSGSAPCQPRLEPLDTVLAWISKPRYPLDQVKDGGTLKKGVNNLFLS
jgi:hypothetical protein